MIKYVKLEIQNLGKIKNLIHTPGAREEVLEKLENNIISSEEIPGAIPAYISKDGDEFKVRYQIMKEITLKEYFKRYITRDELTKIIVNLSSILTSAQEKKVKVNNYLLHLQNVYIDAESDEISLVYIPLKECDKEDLDICKYIKSLISNVKYDTNDDLYFFVSLHNYLNEECWTLEDLISFINNVKIQKNIQKEEVEEKSNKNNNMLFWENNKVEIKQNKTASDNFSSNTIFASNIKLDDKIENSDKPMAIHISTNNVSLENNNYYYEGYEITNKKSSLLQLEEKEGPGTTLLDEDEDEEENEVDNKVNNKEQGFGTTLLDMDDEEEIEKVAALTNITTKKSYLLLKNNSKIGRDSKSCDFVVENKLVGRIHAILIKEAKGFYIEDNNSTNGTFINGNRLTKMAKAKIKDGDAIKLANENFIFKIR